MIINNSTKKHKYYTIRIFQIKLIKNL